MKTLKVILSIACLAALLVSCGQKEENEKKSITVTLSSTEITINNAEPVDVSYTVKDYDGEVTAKLGLAGGGVEMSNRFNSQSGEGVLTFSQPEAARSASQTNVTFTDGKSSQVVDIYISTKFDKWEIVPADPEYGTE